MASPAAELDEEKADQQPPPPMAPPMEEEDDLRPPFSFLSLLLLPDEQQQQIFASAMKKPENLQQGGSVVDDVADGLLRLSLQQEPVVEDDEGSKEDGDADEGASTGKRSKLKRDERQKRRALQKMGMKPVTGVSMVTFVRTEQKNRKALISFSRPDVFKFPGLETYAIFGEGSANLLGSETPAQAAPQGPGVEDAGITYLDESDELTDEECCDEDEYDTDDAGVEAGDISIVMEKAAVSRRMAVRALKLHGGDVVNAIMDLTS